MMMLVTLVLNGFIVASGFTTRHSIARPRQLYLVSLFKSQLKNDDSAEKVQVARLEESFKYQQQKSKRIDITWRDTNENESNQDYAATLANELDAKLEEFEDIVAARFDKVEAELDSHARERVEFEDIVAARFDKFEAELDRQAREVVKLKQLIFLFVIIRIFEFAVG
jgi:hypothetical protein